MTAEAFEEAAAVDALGGGISRQLPEGLRQLVVPAVAAEACRFLSISEAAERLEVTRVTIYAWIKLA